MNTIIQAPLCLIVTAKTSNDEHIASEDFAAVCCLIQNIQMLSWAHGLGMTWNLGDYSGWTEFMNLAGIQENERIAGILSMGFFAPKPEKAVPIELSDKIEVW
ncbi:nitroreductase family protein [Brevibacillus reuszeri]